MTYLKVFRQSDNFHFPLFLCHQTISVNLIKLICPSFQAQTACPSGCHCDQPSNWKTEELLLNCLQEVEISDLRETEREVSFVKRLFNWATVLKKMTVTFDHSITESKAKELCQMLLSFSRPEICMMFYVYQNLSKVLYVPED